jgi:hypothetical protein
VEVFGGIKIHSIGFGSVSPIPPALVSIGSTVVARMSPLSSGGGSSPSIAVHCGISDETLWCAPPLPRIEPSRHAVRPPL